MPPTYEQLANLDRVVHEPVRLAILTALSGCAAADFGFLKRLIGLTSGNLNTHLATLESAGLVVLTKRFDGKTPQTLVGLSVSGRTTIERHWEQLTSLRREARSARMRHRIQTEVPMPSKG